jgi:hypothetical protein
MTASLRTSGERCEYRIVISIVACPCSEPAAVLVAISSGRAGASAGRRLAAVRRA